MAGEQLLLTSADHLADTGDLAYAVTELIGGMESAGGDRAAVVSLIAAHDVLGGAAVTYNPGSRTDREPGSGFGSDVEFLEAIHDVTDQVLDRAGDAGRLADELTEAAAELDTELGEARAELAAALAMPTHVPCEGCHGRKWEAITAAETYIADVQRRIRVVEDATEILGELRPKLDTALGLLRQAPRDLGEAYELVYAYVAAGGKMPTAGRWVEGEGRLCAGATTTGP